MLRWTAPVRGREAKTVEVGASVYHWAEEMVAAGRATGHREYAALTGRPGGLVVVDGTVEGVSGILTDRVFEHLIRRLDAVVEDLDIQMYLGGSDETTDDAKDDFLAVLDELGAEHV